jgi:hypothetical protein
MSSLRDFVFSGLHFLLLKQDNRKNYFVIMIVGYFVAVYFISLQPFFSSAYHFLFYENVILSGFCFSSGLHFYTGGKIAEKLFCDIDCGLLCCHLFYFIHSFLYNKPGGLK